MYTYEVDGVTIAATQSPRLNESLLYAALGVAAVIAFQQVKPVTIKLQGQPYRVLRIDFCNSTLPPPRVF